MARTKEYRHYCPAARTLEVVGEKWSLLIVRDLLFGPLRFTDLLGTLGGITPKWLTQRLRDLEAAGVVERDHAAGRREVWYQLTPKGRDLAPVVEALVGWGIQHGRPPETGESVHPTRAAFGTAAYLNQRKIRVPSPTTWILSFPANQDFTLHFDGERWSCEKGAQSGDVRIETTPETWTTLATATPDERKRLFENIRIEGDPTRVSELTALLGAENPFDVLAEHAIREFEAGRTNDLRDFAAENNVEIVDD
jgi:DNA-binding HxlR family transcriptional regulator